ncbi:MAG: peptidoglycan DD-metalloendopeptidase family protein [Clostridia bacterium]|nr:peptidoglycan DD-metalloendopeptidase family protein [Clostridia bacterium]
MGKKYRSVWYRCLATLLMAVMLLGSVGYAPEAKALTEIVKPLSSLKKTSGFIPNRYITWSGGSSSYSHLATDYSASSGQAVYSIADGVVYAKGYGDEAGYYVVIEHNINGTKAWSRYQHFSKAAIVSKGEKVKAGQQIGTAGSTGNSSGVHLHIQIFTGAYPQYIAYNRSQFSKYELNKEVAGPITKNGTTFWNPHSVITGSQIIGDPNYQADFETLDNQTRIGISTKPASGEDQCYVKEKPLEDSDDKSDSVPKGQTVKIVGAVKNKYGNTWYKTADGGFVWEGDVTVWEYSTLFSVSANFYTVKNQNSHAAPYADSDKIDAYPNGTIFKVKSFVTNSYGNVWVELSDGSYMNFYDKGADIQNVNFVSHVSQPTISGETKPTGNINVTNQGFWLKGTVKAEVPFLTLCTRIIDRETGKDVEGRSPTTIKPGNVKSVAISKDNDSKDLDSLTKFTNLPKGWYQYQLNAQFGFTYSGKTFQFGGTHNFITSDFTVGNPGTLDVAPTPEVKGKLTIGNATKNGNILEIPVGIQGNPGLVGVSMEVTLPDEFKNFNATAEGIGTGALVYTDGVNGGNKIALMSTTPMTGDGNLFKIHLPLDGVNIKEFSLKIKCASAGDAEGEDTMLSSVEKLIQLSSGRTPGDANEDGTVGWADLILMLKYVSGWSVSLNTANADVTADGSVGWTDLILLLKYVSGWNVELK